MGGDVHTAASSEGPGRDWGVTGHLWLPLCAGNGGQSGPVDSCHRDTFVMSRCLPDELALGVAFGLKTGW